MANVAGGSKCNLVTGYQEGEDASLNYGRHHWLAQTFTITAEHVLWRHLVKSFTTIGGRFYHYALRNTDAGGKPTGADIVHTTLSPTGEDFYSPGKWRRFDFDEFPQLAAGTYAIILSVPDSPDTVSYKARADETAPTYALGKCWKSTDSGVTWLEVPNTDLMFQVWGWEPPPLPPPAPVVSNWAPLELDKLHLLEAMKIIVTTDIPVHLFMRWTDKEPLTHPTELIRRGISLPYATRWCFVAFHENEQEEAGDTYVHTFVKENWPICQTRWFYFIGTKQAEEQPSASPIFHYHRAEPPTPTQWFYSYPHQELVVPADHAWQELVIPPFNRPLTDILPVNTVGLFLHIHNTGGWERMGFRPKSSIWNIYWQWEGGSHHWAFAACDSDLKTEAWVDDSTDQKIWLEGYVLEGGAVFFINPVKKTPLVFNAWQDIDLAALCPDAIGILAECYSTVGGWTWGIRKKGSSDSRDRGSGHTWPIIGCDATQQIQYYTGAIAGNPMELYIWGYIPAHALFNTNAPDITPALFGSYETVQLAPPARLAFIEVHAQIANINYDLRPAGKHWQTYDLLTSQHGWAVVGVDTFNHLQAKIENNNLAIYLIGYGM